MDFSLTDESHENSRPISGLEEMVDAALEMSRSGISDIYLAADGKILFPVGHSSPQFGPGFSKEANAIMSIYDREGMSWGEFRSSLRMCGVPLDDDGDAVREMGMGDNVLAAAEEINARRNQLMNNHEERLDAA